LLQQQVKFRGEGQASALPMNVFFHGEWRCHLGLYYFMESKVISDQSGDAFLVNEHTSSSFTTV
jgi:hypothetical protein